MPGDALVWFRRDLRSHEHAALYHALKNARRVHCAFVFDSEILDVLESRTDRRVEFIWESVRELKRDLLYAQPPAHDHGLVPRQGFARGLEAEGALLRGESQRL
ncbi:MAG: deoxyribodipyrimidine photo-lyase [Burkholderiales bacterium]